MSVLSLADFVERLEAVGQLVRVTAQVDSDLEIAEITRRVACGGPAILFQQVAGAGQPVVTNLFGSDQRVCLATGADSLDQLGLRLLGGGGKEKEAGWLQRLAANFQNSGMEALAPKAVTTAACQQVVKPGRDVALDKLPALRCAPDETAPCLSGGLVITADAGGSQRALLRCDLQVVDRSSLAISWSPHDALAAHFESFRRAGEKMPVAVVVGGPPALMLAAVATIPRAVDPYVFAGLMAGAPLQLVTCRSLALQVPADAEMVMEGYVDPDDALLPARTMASATGFYRVPADARAFRAAVVTERASPMLPAMVLGRPPNELSQLAAAVERIFLPLWRQTIDELVDFVRPAFAPPGQVAFVSIRKSYPHQARKVAAALWGQDATMLTKLLVIVDEHVDVHADQEVWFRVAANVNPQRDVFFQRGASDPADHAACGLGAGERMAIDATGKLPDECGGPWPGELLASPEVRAAVQERWQELGLDDHRFANRTTAKAKP